MEKEKNREEPEVLRGLTGEEVEERIRKGLVNRTDISTGKSVREIIRSNVFTYFNLIFLVLTVLLCFAQSYRNIIVFLPIVVGNTLIGIVQELRAKRILDKMNILNAPHSIVLREGEEAEIPSEELVKDDIVLLSAGNQICADAIVVEGNIQVNESLLTGESDEIGKKEGSQLLSGSFVVSGQCYARLVHVGEESYISKLSSEAKAMGEGEQSEMVRSINRIVLFVGIVIIPIGAILFYQGYFVNGTGLRTSIVSMVAAVIGMIPEGLYLLTTIALALSAVRLAMKKVLLHDMKSIEALARVDVLCVDKTGTITEPDMKVEKMILSQYNEGVIQNTEELEKLLLDYIDVVPDNNATMQAIRSYFGKTPEEETGKKSRKKKKTLKKTAAHQKAEEILPFSSRTKYSGVSFQNRHFLLGAPEFIMGDRFSLLSEEIASYTQEGYRVLLFGEYQGNSIKETLTQKVIPLGYLMLENPIRENAEETFQYFREQGVEVKVISGDHPETVATIAERAGIEDADAYVDASTLDTDWKLEKALEEYTVFGRVTPKQKQKFVKALQAAGHTVAMTGDGVNDILAMKDADCSVAMASGSEAATQAAQVVLLDSDFAHMPDVVSEGRCVVNNLQRSASLFLVKNIFSFLLSVLSAVFLFTYPLEPAQISLISMFTIGIPGFLLALEPNKKRIEGNFLKNVLLSALPAGITDVFAVGALVICGAVFGLPSKDIATAATMLLAVVGFMILIKISQPFTPLKYVVLVANICGLLFCGIFFNHLFALKKMSTICIFLMVIFAFAAESFFRYFTIFVEWLSKLGKNN